MDLIETHRWKGEQKVTDADKLNLVDILLSQQGEDKLSDNAMAAVLFVSLPTERFCSCPCAYIEAELLSRILKEK